MEEKEKKSVVVMWWRWGMITMHRIVDDGCARKKWKQGFQN